MFKIIPKVKNILFENEISNFFPNNKTFFLNKKLFFIKDTILEINSYVKEFKYTESNKKDAFINFIYDKNIFNDNYEIVFDGLIKIKSNSKNGFVYALSTLTQIFMQTNKSSYFVIKDSSKYSWRGIMFDPCRHFFNYIDVKSLLFYSFLYKINKFHMHLNDDQGWRIEIKKYPLLTEIGSKRVNKDGTKSEGYYSQKNIKDFVSLGDKFGIEIIPEIDLPGHTRAATYSYPELLCDGNKKSKITDEWGVFNEVLCVSNDKSFTFTKNVLNEIFNMFPSKNVHIGGDECPSESWKKCKNCQNKIKEMGFKTEYELQTLFINNINNQLLNNEKRAIAWDDLFEYDFPFKENFIFALWRNWKIKDYKNVFSKINSVDNIQILFNSNSHTYFDHGYDEEYNEKNGIPKGWINNLKNSFYFDPIESMNELNTTKIDISNKIIGSECSLWSERFETFEELTERLFPRLLAFSSRLWGTDESYDEFIERCKIHKKIMKNLDVEISYIK